MRNPGKPGSGFTGAVLSLAGDHSTVVNAADSLCNDQCECRAAALDRLADFHLQQGLHCAAEWLAWRAEALREAAGQ